MSHSNQSRAACECGTNSVGIRAKPLARFICHCTICQSVYQKPFADFIVFSGKDVEMEACTSVEYKRHKLPPALRRGTCVSCHTPTIAWMNLGVAKLAFIPVANVDESLTLPEPLAHLFYDRAIESVEDDVEKLSGYWASEWCVSKKLIAGLMTGSSS